MQLIPERKEQNRKKTVSTINTGRCRHTRTSFFPINICEIAVVLDADRVAPRKCVEPLRRAAAGKLTVIDPSGAINHEQQY